MHLRTSYDNTAQNLREQWFQLTRIFLYREKIVEFAPIRENMSQQKPVYIHNLCSANADLILIVLMLQSSNSIFATKT